MKKQILFKSALSLVAAAAAGSAFAATEFSDNFESYSTGSFEGNAITAKGWVKDAQDTSTIIDDGTGSNQVLKLNTEGTDLKNVFDSDVAGALNAAATTNGAYFSAKVKFVASDDLAVSGIPAFEDSTKFAVYAYANPVTETNNLVIVHGYLDGNGDPAVTNEVFTGITIDPEQFYTLNFQLFNDTAEGGTGYMLFTASFDGNPLATAVTDDITTEKGTAYMLALCSPSATGFSEIAFKGTGEVDDIDVGSVEAAETTWATILGVAVDGAYQIDNLAELESFQAGVAAGLTTTNTTFKLTADIALANAWPGIGIQNGKDIYNTSEFNEGAFRGTFDGQNFTISGFQMQGGGLDYCGFFNSTYQATIKNLKIAYAASLFATDTAANSSAESGATFVGVAKESTLQNLTTLAGTVSCDKGFGGIVGYLTCGSLVDSCTNNVNMTSLRPNKCGGIAMITQNGSAVTIVNCQNNGTIAGSNETGSLVGFVGLGTTISNCDSKVAYKLFHHNSGTVTISDVTADASVAAYTGTAAPGLNFATVTNGVATFVADGALAAGNTYKVMTAVATTATYEFTAAGTIAFDESIAIPTYAITAAAGSGLDTPTSNKVGNVTTWTAAAAAPAGFDGGDGVTTFSIAAATQTTLEAALNASGKTLTDVADSDSGLTYAQAYALGLWDENATEVAPLNAEITFDDQGQPEVKLDATAGATYTVTCTLYGSTTLPVDTTDAQNIVASGPLGTALVDDDASSDTAKFYKVVVVISDQQQ